MGVKGGFGWCPVSQVSVQPGAARLPELPNFVLVSSLQCLFITGHNTTWHWCNRWWSAADIERPVVRHYGFPIASYRDAVWPKLNHPRPDLPCMWNGKSHPDSITHSLIGDVIAYGLIRALLDSSTSGNQQCDTSPQPKMFHPQMETIEYCAPPDADEPSTAVSGTFMSAFQPSVFEPVVSGGWYWREDVPGKPGGCRRVGVLHVVRPRVFACIVLVLISSQRVRVATACQKHKPNHSLTPDCCAMFDIHDGCRLDL